jgi:hypothetical protein
MPIIGKSLRCINSEVHSNSKSDSQSAAKMAKSNCENLIPLRKNKYCHFNTNINNIDAHIF